MISVNTVHRHTKRLTLDADQRMKIGEMAVNQPKTKSMLGCLSPCPLPGTERSVAEWRILHKVQFFNTHQCSIYGLSYQDDYADMTR